MRDISIYPRHLFLYDTYTRYVPCTCVMYQQLLWCDMWQHLPLYEMCKQLLWYHICTSACYCMTGTSCGYLISFFTPLITESLIILFYRQEMKFFNRITTATVNPGTQTSTMTYGGVA